MGKLKGCKKTGGRQKGTPNRKSRELSQYFETKGIFIPDLICQDLPLLDPDKRINVLLKLLEFLYPKRRAIDLDHSLETSSSPVDLSKCSKEELLVLKQIALRNEDISTNH